MASLHQTTLFVVVVNIVDDDCMNTVALWPMLGVWGICSSKQWAQQHHQLKKHACNAHASFKHCLQTTLFVVVVNIVDFQC